MSDAVPVPKGHLWHVTASTLLRRNSFSPSSRKLMQVFDSLLTEAAERYDIDLVAWCLLPNHYHVVLFDPGRNNPLFVQWFNSQLALATNEIRGTQGIVIQPGAVCREAILDEEAAIRTIAYVSSNPVKHGMVEDPATYPGAWSGPEGLDATRTVEPPKLSMFRRGRFSDRLAIRPTLERYEPDPQAREHLHSVLAARHRERVSFHRLRRQAEGKGFLGPRGCRRIVWHVCGPARRGVGRKPFFVTSNEALREATWEAYDSFLRSYEGALELWKDGRHSDATFPANAWRVSMSYGARTAAA